MKALQSIRVRFKNHSNLKASRSFLQLQATLTDVKKINYSDKKGFIVKHKKE
ncbi:MAG: hypothetical protein JHC31_05750 [Sulfurihydrogenibium sp.]|nr:hypothetical protein [Sulfurihydrogenibium sp.]